MLVVTGSAPAWCPDMRFELPRMEFLWWVDSDAVFTDMRFKLSWESYAAHNLFAKELSARPPFEADNQSALIYLLVTRRERWGNKVFFENSYELNGF